MGKLIAKTAIITFFVIVVLICIVSGMFIWLAPKNVAKTCESLGFDVLSIKMYERAYKKDKSINNLHLLVSKSITLDNSDILIKYYPLLESRDDYEEFINALDSANYDENADVIVNVKLSNEDNRLKTRYVSALAKENFEKAFDYAIQDLFEIDITNDNINFCITGLARYISETNIENFVTANQDFENITVCQKIAQLYSDLKTRYNLGVSSDYQGAILSGKLVDMIQFMLLLEGKTQNSGYDKTTLTNDLEAIFAEYKQYID